MTQRMTCWISFVVIFNQSCPLWRDTISTLSKSNQLVGMDPYAFAMSKHVVTKVDSCVLASFRACQTMERCSQQPGAFSMLPFTMKLSMNLFSHIEWVSRHLGVRLKKVCTQHLKELLGKRLRVWYQMEC